MAQAIKRIEENQEAEGLESRGLDLRPLALALAFAGLGVAELERRLAGEPVRLEAVRAARRRARLDRHRIMALRDGEDLPPWSPADQRALAEADRTEAKAEKGKRGAPAIRDAARRQRDRIAADRQARAEARRAELRLAETVRLDGEREGLAEADVLERKRGQVKPRLRTRDGLKMLHESGGLSPAKGSPVDRRIEADRQLAIGLRYRDRYEIAQASLKSCLAMAEDPRGPATFWVQFKTASRRAALVNSVRVLETAVVTRLGEEALMVLRLIAGEARTINSITTSARRRARLTGLLAQALAVVGDKLAAPR